MILLNRAGLLTALLIVLNSASVMAATVTYIGRAALPGGINGTASDLSGLPHTLLEDNTTYQDRFDGIGSGMAYTGFGNRYLLLNDRGPNKVAYAGGAAVDNTTSYKDRFQVADITLTGSGNNYAVNVNLVATSMLTNTSGQNYVGISTAHASANAATNLRLDPEGISVAPDGTVYISDEYGPVIHHFSQTGTLLNTIAVPAKFLVSNVSNTVSAEISGNTSGRVGNKGMEGLAITPDGTVMIGAMQSPLLQDATETGVNSNGTNVRFLKYDLTNPSAAPQEFVYQLDTAANLVSEIVAVNSHQFLVNERDAVGGLSGGIKNLYLIDLNQAIAPTDVSGVATLNQTGNTPGVVALDKVLFADVDALLRAAPGALVGGSLPDKFEGYAFGPDLPDGRHTLLATNDNDYSTAYPNYVFAFAIDQNYFADFQVRQLNEGVGFLPAPEPSSFVLLGMGLAALAQYRKRKLHSQVA